MCGCQKLLLLMIDVRKIELILKTTCCCVRGNCRTASSLWDGRLELERRGEKMLTTVMQVSWVVRAFQVWHMNLLKGEANQVRLWL